MPNQRKVTSFWKVHHRAGGDVKLHFGCGRLDREEQTW